MQSQYAGAILGGLLALVGLYWLVPTVVSRRSKAFRPHLRPSPPTGGESFTVACDVSATASRLRNTARIRLALSASGALFILYGLLPILWPWSIVCVPLGILLAVVAPHLILVARPDIPAESIRTTHHRLRVRIYFATAVVLVVSGILFIFIGIVLNAAVSTVPTQQLDPDVSSGTSAAFLLIGIAALGAGIGIHVRARRLAARDATEAMRRDPRPPLVYLRCFGDEGIRLLRAIGARSNFLDQLSPRRTDSFERALARCLDKFGPFVALNPPGTRLAPLGAARLSVDGEDNWHGTIKEWISRASRIVVLVPPAELGPSLLWELQHVTAPELIDKVILVVPPLAAGDMAQRLVTFLDGISSIPAFSTLPAAASPEARALIWRGEWQAITSHGAGEWSYRGALEWAAQAGPNLEPVPTTSGTESGFDVSRPVTSPQRPLGPTKRSLVPTIVWVGAGALCLLATVGTGVWAAVVNRHITLGIPESIGGLARLNSGKFAGQAEALEQELTAYSGNSSVAGEFGSGGQPEFIVAATALAQPPTEPPLPSFEHGLSDGLGRRGASVSFDDQSVTVMGATAYACAIATIESHEASLEEKVCMWTDPNTTGMLIANPSLNALLASELSHRRIVGQSSP